jgi:hypothetical protein
MRIGDRVEVHTYRGHKNVPTIYRGVIVGTARKGEAWIIQRDDIKSPQAFHKDFCHPERKEE